MSAAEDVDVALVGAGIMSATVAALLRELDPALRIVMFERLDRAAGESTDARNNAGTGHSALCELNYTPADEAGRIRTGKAVKILESFEVSKQFWAHLVASGCFDRPSSFINTVPHVSFVWGDDVGFLRARYEALSAYPQFEGLEYTEDHGVMRAWMPLVMRAREPQERLAATRSRLGTDIDFGALARGLIAWLQRSPGFELALRHEVDRLEQQGDGRWLVDAESDGRRRRVRARFVFLGAGGGALDLLDGSGIPEGEGFGGFPVSGLWLMCRNPDLIAQHDAKVYGMAKLGAPPMSVPHLDSRFIDGKRELLFGPFAGFTTRFLKEGSYLDLPASLTLDNVLPMLSAGVRNAGLTRYLIGQGLQSFEDRMDALREFLPDAWPDDWELAVAGQRVQIIKQDPEGGGTLEFGTEIVSAADNTLAALLGASPGASTSVSIALDLLADCFPERMASPEWRRKLAEMVPTYGQDLRQDPSLLAAARRQSHAVLRLAL